MAQKADLIKNILAAMRELSEKERDIKPVKIKIGNGQFLVLNLEESKPSFLIVHKGGKKD